ncbi:MAG: hypothetical protein HEQ34_01605 [Sphingorhabdus sp.]|uniref:hypothetical protein n=1 Tax=Sphingorhabdus sp. TaxID=1902408 RepID=UPI0025E87DB1|nr:hypothetical protein [Sphingorhabdus sp.]MCO4090635.1 hypothetical protein [Sphingorhabdus sp.]
MTDQGPLIVPITVEAVVVNDHLREGGNVFVRSQMQYGQLKLGLNGQAGAASNDTNFTSSGYVGSVLASDYYNGVYLKWRLPRALTTGTQDAQNSVTNYPLVPNRWLVVRYSGPKTARISTAWIIESDYIWPSGPSDPASASTVGSLYMVAAGGSGKAESTYIGRNILLGSWSESGQSLGLTAMGPGNPAFSAYQPHNNNVFSFIDPLNGEADGTMSYQVIGWFSSGKDDPLAGLTAANFLDAIAALGWTLPDGTVADAFASWSLYTGSVTGVAWQSGALPPGGAPNQTPVSIAVGNSSIEALTALVTAQSQGTDVQPELLEAFQLDMLDVMDEPDGAARLADKLKSSFYQRFNGGFSWDIVDAPGADPVAPAELAKEEKWLAVLVQNQQKLDDDLRTLAALQAQLYVMWWKFLRWPQAIGPTCAVPGLEDDTKLSAALQPADPTSLAGKVAAQLAIVNADLQTVPQGDTPDALNSAIMAHARAQALPATRILKRIAKTPFRLPNNPVVLIAGAGSSGIVKNPFSLLCRFPTQLLTGISYAGTTISAATPHLTIPQPDVSQASGAPWTAPLIASLVDEFFLTDPYNAAIIAQALSSSDQEGIATAMGDPGVAVPVNCYPVASVNRWTQNPWHPLLLIWEANYYPVSMGTAATPNWVYEDGQYHWSSGTGVEDVQTIGGLIQLTPAATFNMGARLNAFLTSNPNLPQDELDALNALLSQVQNADAWDLLSQTLDGFNNQLQLGMSGVFLGPTATTVVTTPSLPDLLGGIGSYPPDLGNIPETTPFPTSAFQSWRAGQFSFSTLVVIDEWGQALWPITQQSQATEQVFLPDDLAPVLTSTPATLTVTKASTGTTTDMEPQAVGATASITALSPDLIEAGTASTALLPMAVTGNGFTADSVVFWNTVALATDFVSATSLIADLPAALLAVPGQAEISVASGGSTSATMPFIVSAGAAIGSISPASVQQGAATFTLTVNGVGFSPFSGLQMGPPNSAATPLATQFVSATQLTATVPAALVATAGAFEVVESQGSKVLPTASETLIQLPPVLLQPARLDFDMVSANDDQLIFGPANPDADPICGWVLPNHLDSALSVYDADGAALGEMAVGVPISGAATICWRNAPNSAYSSLADIATNLPHFGPFLLALSQRTLAQFADFLQSIDETLWLTVPMGANFDNSLAALFGRPLAMVRARLDLMLDGPVLPDPSWQFTFAPAPSPLPDYEFAVELGDIARVDDGLIGYFADDNYNQFNIVEQSGAAADGYLNPIRGTARNYLFLQPTGAASYISMLVDPRAAVHATSAILPTVSVTPPLHFVDAALAAMNICFGIDGVMTDQIISAEGDVTLMLPTPKLKVGNWTWLENESSGWTSYPTAKIDNRARLSNVAPVLRRGMLQLSSGISSAAAHTEKQ